MSPTDPILHDAMTKRDAALAEAARWSDFVSMYMEIKGIADPVPEKRETGTIKERVQPPRGAALAETERAAFDAIRASGRPMHTQELLKALQEAGVEVGGKDPASTLSARLSRAPSLENVRPHGWRIKSPPPSAASPPAATAFVFGPRPASAGPSVFDMGGRDDGSDLA